VFSRSSSGNDPANAGQAGSPAPAAGGAPGPGKEPVEHFKLPPYTGPKSHHASRAFADMQARARKRRLRMKIAIVVAALMVGGGLVWSASHGLFRW